MADGHLSPPTRRLISLSAEPLPAGTYAVDLGVDRRGDGRWQVSQYAHVITRHREKDTFTDALSDWPDEDQAKAELARLKAGRAEAA